MTLSSGAQQHVIQCAGSLFSKYRHRIDIGQYFRIEISVLVICATSNIGTTLVLNLATMSYIFNIQVCSVVSQNPGLVPRWFLGDGTLPNIPVKYKQSGIPLVITSFQQGLCLANYSGEGGKWECCMF